MTVLTNTQGIINLTQNVDGTLQGFTLVRTILTLIGYASVDESSGDACLLHYGVVVVDADARVAGAVPDPGGVPDNVQWVLRDQVLLVNQAASINPKHLFPPAPCPL